MPSRVATWRVLLGRERHRARHRIDRPELRQHLHRHLRAAGGHIDSAPPAKHILRVALTTSTVMALVGVGILVWGGADDVGYVALILALFVFARSITYIYTVILSLQHRDALRVQATAAIAVVKVISVFLLAYKFGGYGAAVACVYCEFTMVFVYRHALYDPSAGTGSSPGRRRHCESNLLVGEGPQPRVHGRPDDGQARNGHGQSIFRRPSHLPVQHPGVHEGRPPTRRQTRRRTRRTRIPQRQGRRSLVHTRFDLDGLVSAIDETESDVFVADHTYLGEPFLRSEKAGTVPLAVNTVVSETLVWKATRGVVGKLDSNRILRDELRVARSAYTVGTYDEDEAGFYRDAGIDRAHWLDLTLPPKKQVNVAGSTRRLVFFGDRQWPPNQAFEILLGWWPDIARGIDDAELCIVGSPDPSAKPIELPDGVRDLGFVDDLDAFLDTCRALVAPIMTGGGVR